MKIRNVTTSDLPKMSHVWHDSQIPQSTPSIVISNPLFEETNFLVSSLNNQRYRGKKIHIGKLDCWFFPDLNTLIVTGGHGKAQFAVQTQYLIDRWKCKLIICAGAAGSLLSKLRVGDLVIGDSTIEHDYNLQFVRRPLPQFPGHPSTIKELRTLVSKTDFDFKGHFGKIASGDEDVITSTRVKALYAKTRACCVAWEGSGGARACQFNDIPFLEIRAITDVADKNAPQHFEKNLKRAMDNFSVFLTRWLVAKT